MKVGITGHMSGLGKSLFDLFENAIGFDIDNGYNIQEPMPIVEIAKTCDVFINNAYYNYCQADLLERMFNEWRETTKTIVNISSVAADAPVPFEQFGFYPMHKKALDDASTRLQYVGKSCRIINIKPGWINTPMSKDFKADKMDPNVLASEIKNIILSNNDIQSLTIGTIYFA
jgi:NAD(P)-dependent dehydrogenase (short-subunit alcohol dehydrogenase family)